MRQNTSMPAISLPDKKTEGEKTGKGKF